MATAGSITSAATAAAPASTEASTSPPSVPTSTVSRSDDGKAISATARSARSSSSSVGGGASTVKRKLGDRENSGPDLETKKGKTAMSHQISIGDSSSNEYHRDQELPIVPIRVDVRSEDKAIRIVDTLLLDPSCWPIPLYQPVYEAVEDNIANIAHTVLSDAEVQGMGRTVRHFTGRLDLWNPKLQEDVENQLRPQLWKAFHILQNCNNIPRKKSNNSNTTAATSTIQSKSTPSTTGDGDKKQSSSAVDSSTSSLVPISIRLVVDDVVINDDFYWDKNPRNNLLSPFEFAKDMADEWNLSDEAAVAIATSIVEQLYGLSIDASPDPTVTNADSDTTKDVKKEPINTPASTLTSTATTGKLLPKNSSEKWGAWKLDPKQHASMSSQIVAHHRSI